MGPQQDAAPNNSFGESGGRLTYGGYLRVPELLSLQRPETDTHDEMLFIVTHQVYELWFKQLLHELEAARDAMYDGRLWWCRHTLTRIRTIDRMLVQQIDVLLTMTAPDFLEFRHRLAPASGFQSVQYREMEFLSGVKDPGYLERFRGLTEDEVRRLQRRLHEPSLWDAFVSVLERSGLAAEPDQIVDSLVKVARDRSTYGEIWDVAEGLLGHDEAQMNWRGRHVTMVERQIGAKTGTGGSSGAEYLRTRTTLRFYPALWEMRNRL